MHHALVRFSGLCALLLVTAAGCDLDETSTGVIGDTASPAATDEDDDTWSSSSTSGWSPETTTGAEASSSSGDLTSTGLVATTTETEGETDEPLDETGTPEDHPCQCEPGLAHDLVCTAVAQQAFACDPTQHGTVELLAHQCTLTLDPIEDETCRAALLGKMLCLSRLPCLPDADAVAVCGDTFERVAAHCPP